MNVISLTQVRISLFANYFTHFYDRITFFYIATTVRKPIAGNYRVSKKNWSLSYWTTLRTYCWNSWFAINLSGCGGQCQTPTPTESDNGINKIFLCVVPPTWPPWRQMQTTNNTIRVYNQQDVVTNVRKKFSMQISTALEFLVRCFRSINGLLIWYASYTGHKSI